MAQGLGWDDREGWSYITGTNSGTGNGRPGKRYVRSVNRPAATVDTKAARTNWKLLSPGRSYTARPRVADPATEPAPTIALGHNAAAWCWERPATTVTASSGVINPNGGGKTVSMSERGQIPVEPWELGVLQGFAPDHPWQSPKVSAQIGNAFPPPLAEACLRAVTGLA